MANFKIRKVFIAAALLSAAMSCFAEDDEEEFTITVNASKIEQDISETTEDVQVITEEEIKETGAHTLNEVLNVVQGMSFLGKSVGNSEPLQLNGFTDEYVKILIDGVPVTTGGASDIISKISIDNIDHIEVIEGSSSAMWGSDAIAGVINIVTKKPDDTKIVTGNICVEGGTNKEIDGNGDITFNLNGFSAQLTGGTTYSDGIYEEGTYTSATGKNYTYNDYSVPNEFDWNAGAKLKYVFDEGRDILLNVDYLDATTKDVSSTQNENGYYQPYYNTLNGVLKSDWKINESHSLSGYISGRQYISGTNNQEFSGSYEDKTSKVFQDVEGELTYTGYITSDNQIMAGVNTLGSFYNDNSSSESYDSLSTSLFAQDMIQIDTLQIVPGFRCYWAIPVDSTHDEELVFNFSPKLNLKWDINDIVSLKLSGGSGFKMPTLTEKYNDHYKGKGNPDLLPQTSYSVNFNSDIKPVSGMKIAAGTYFTYLINMIDAVSWYDEDGNWGGRNYENAGNVISTGANIQLTYKFSDWNTSLGYNYLFMRKVEDDGSLTELSGKIPHQIKASVSYKVPVTLTDINLNCVWYAPFTKSNAWNYTNPETTITSDYLMVNLRVEQKLLDDSLTLYCGVKNLLNNFSFMTGTNNSTMEDDFETAGEITFYAGVKYSF